MHRRILAALVAAAVAGIGPDAVASTRTLLPRHRGLDAALGARRGAIVLVAPRTGEILGVAGSGLGEAAPPGSIAKLVTAYAALAAGTTSPDRRIACRGHFSGRTCARAHGSLDVAGALAASCNVHFLVLGAELGSVRLARAARAFGFGAPTGALAGESRGRVDERARALDLAYGVGPGFTATPLQLARAIAAVANGGHVLHLRPGPGAAGEVGSLDERWLRPIRAGLVAAARSGTARAVGLTGLAGKTGTAESAAGADGTWNGHFAGFMPHDGAGVALAVRVEGRSAMHDAVPVARRALREFVPGIAHPSGAPAAARGSRLTRDTVRVRLFAARTVRALDLSGAGATLVRGGERRAIPAGGLRVAASAGGTWIVRPYPGGTLTLRPHDARHRGRPASVPSRSIPGAVVVRFAGGELAVTAELELDAYAAAVARAESGPDWPAQALAAQAILARTYALRHAGRHAAQIADLCDSAHCQVYQGERPIPPAAAAALDAVRGAVLLDGAEPAEALFHAACGGRILPNEEVFGGKPVTYLRGGADPWCAAAPAGAAWRAHLTWRDLTAAAAKAPDLGVGAVTDLGFSGRTPSGLPADVLLRGSAGDARISGYQLWRRLGAARGWGEVPGVRYFPVRLEGGVVLVGRGRGHGVGLCQWGARERARRGASAADILAAYFPGTRLGTP